MLQSSELGADRRLLQDKLEGDSLTESFGSLLLAGDPVNLGCGNVLSLPPEEGIYCVTIVTARKKIYTMSVSYWHNLPYVDPKMLLLIG